MSKSVKFYYCFGAIFFIENNEVYYICKDGVIRSSCYSPNGVERFIWFEFIEEVFND